MRAMRFQAGSLCFASLLLGIPSAGLCDDALPPFVLSRVAPVYPREANAKKIEGRVSVEIHMEVDGSVTDVRVVESEPTGVFEEAVRQAVMQ